MGPTGRSGGDALETWGVGGWGDEFLQKHVKPEFAARLRAEKRAGGSGFETIKWKQRLYQDMNIEIARANYRMLMERTLPPRVA